MPRHASLILFTHVAIRHQDYHLASFFRHHQKLIPVCSLGDLFWTANHVLLQHATVYTKLKLRCVLFSHYHPPSPSDYFSTVTSAGRWLVSPSTHWENRKQSLCDAYTDSFVILQTDSANTFTNKHPLQLSWHSIVALWTTTARFAVHCQSKATFCFPQSPSMVPGKEDSFFSFWLYYPPFTCHCRWLFLV